MAAHLFTLSVILLHAPPYLHISWGLYAWTTSPPPLSGDHSVTHQSALTSHTDLPHFVGIHLQVWFGRIPAVVTTDPDIIRSVGFKGMQRPVRGPVWGHV